MYTDFSETVNMLPFVKPDETFNIPMCMYKSGSHFGDNEVLLQQIGYRTYTCISFEDSTLYVINKATMDKVLTNFKEIRDEFYEIAHKKLEYYIILLDELKHKYTKKVSISELYNEKKATNTLTICQ